MEMILIRSFRCYEEPDQTIVIHCLIKGKEPKVQGRDRPIFLCIDYEATGLEPGETETKELIRMFKDVSWNNKPKPIQEFELMNLLGDGFPQPPDEIKMRVKALARALECKCRISFDIDFTQFFIRVKEPVFLTLKDVEEIATALLTK